MALHWLGQNDSRYPLPVVEEFCPDIQTLNDPLSRLMLLIVTFIGTLVHVFSLVYMRKDKGSRDILEPSAFVFHAGHRPLLQLGHDVHLLGTGGCFQLSLISHWFENRRPPMPVKKPLSPIALEMSVSS